MTLRWTVQRLQEKNSCSDNDQETHQYEVYKDFMSYDCSHQNMWGRSIFSLVGCSLLHSLSYTHCFGLAPVVLLQVTQQIEFWTSDIRGYGSFAVYGEQLPLSSAECYVTCLGDKGPNFSLSPKHWRLSWQLLLPQGDLWTCNTNSELQATK